ncbi:MULTISPECIES: hypothetical protein [pseudomallei group]|uniref:hypothetical protein n=1 Tax=pseudomallei group TaxID=111527 RepID=UPI0011CD8128|nr:MULTISPECIES: hypothetical protein [pseudomallei group]
MAVFSICLHYNLTELSLIGHFVLGRILYMRTVFATKKRRPGVVMKEESTARLRCKPGDLARVIYAKSPLLIGRMVIVEGWNDDGRWNVRLLGDPCFGVAMYTKRPVITCAFAARDSSLEPIVPSNLKLSRRSVDHLNPEVSAWC